MNSEIIIYHPNTLSNHIEVRMEDETVWLTQLQMADLFQTSRNNITLHIANIFKEGELEETSVGKNSLLTANDGKKYKTKIYNLDVIISVGYRVKSKTGTQFRIWANKIVKEYLLKGYAIHGRMDLLEKKVNAIELKNNEFEFILKTNLPSSQGIFYEGQLFDAHVFISKIIKSAKVSIQLIDNYIDESVLTLLSKRAAGVTIQIYTKNITKQVQLDVDCFNKQYESIEIKQFYKSHDRFLIIDQKIVYHIGASLKDLGKKWFAFSKLSIDAKEIINRL